ncbi:MAG: sigma-54-dependent Fis family transcriptional regulator [Bacteroidales bacterium]|nr:sigma-54-dependent Fis family transcriptional regulator [Bacteroidales bacterium]
MSLQQVKQRFGIIGNAPGLNRAIEVAMQVAPTDLSVLITGESGVGKEVMPQIIHHRSKRKHNSYIAVNCGAIPEGTIDSELFGHIKGSFTTAISDRKGYFEEADKGTIFLDEIAELPLATQVRLLRVLESGEFMRVGSSKVQKTDVRVIAATNVNIQKAVQEGKFREDLYYRLNTVPLHLPPLRDRGEDISLLFRKFAADFAEKYRMPAIRLDQQAQEQLQKFRWPGNIRQLKNITEQISVIEENRNVGVNVLIKYLPNIEQSALPVLVSKQEESSFASEREILYKILFDMKNDMNELKSLVNEILSLNPQINLPSDEFIDSYFNGNDSIRIEPRITQTSPSVIADDKDIEDTKVIADENLSISDNEKELIIKALEKYNGRRKLAAEELGISERTLYRKLKEYNIED